jgi:hypothetical protein
MEVSHLLAEQHSTKPAQQRISDVTILPRHRARGDAAAEPITYHKIGATSEFVHETI